MSLDWGQTCWLVCANGFVNGFFAGGAALRTRFGVCVAALTADGPGGTVF